jgi:hypothetical protein
MHTELFLAGRELAVAMTSALDEELRHHFDHPGRQEDLTFAYWRPSVGARRLTALVHELNLPVGDERILEGNVSFTAEYLTRVLKEVPAGSGIVLLHSHLGRGWQDMSMDDDVAERDRLASAVAGVTELPLVGMTWGTDGTWSARMWGRQASFQYERIDVRSVRVVGSEGLRMSFHPVLAPAAGPNGAQVATASVWGRRVQADISRVTFGITGLGSVGSLLAEGAARTGFSSFVLVDHDRLEERNLDRTTNATAADVTARRRKVSIAARAIRRSHTSATVTVETIPTTALTGDAIAQLLDCDVIVSCVDRPLPRWLLNTLAYSHLIPVVDGGIQAAVTPAGTPLHIDWRIHTVGPGRACLVCLGALRRSDVGLERDGLLDDADYIAGLSETEKERYNRRNVFGFSMAVAAHELLQVVGMLSGTSRIGGVGPQHYSAYPGEMVVTRTAPCEEGCEFAALVATAVPVSDLL